MMLGAVQLVMAGLGIALMTYFDSTCKGVLTDQALNILLLVVTTSQVWYGLYLHFDRGTPCVVFVRQCCRRRRCCWGWWCW